MAADFAASKMFEHGIVLLRKKSVVDSAKVAKVLEIGSEFISENKMVTTSLAGITKCYMIDKSTDLKLKLSKDNYGAGAVYWDQFDPVSAFPKDKQVHSNLQYYFY
jgi:hypothetical protein